MKGARKGIASMDPRIGILDDFDRPEGRTLVIVYGDPDHPFVQYIHPAKRSLLRRGRRHDAGMPKLFTAVERFGVTLSFDADRQLLVHQVGESRASYRDGVPRRWQGDKIEAIAVRPEIAGEVMKAMQHALQARAAA